MHACLAIAPAADDPGGPSPGSSCRRRLSRAAAAEEAAIATLPAPMRAAPMLNRALTRSPWGRHLRRAGVRPYLHSDPLRNAPLRLRGVAMRAQEGCADMGRATTAYTQ